MAQKKINPKKIRQAAAMKGIFSIAELARKAGCSRNCFYAFKQNPRRASKARARIKELINV